jgi:hypothetical protein
VSGTAVAVGRIGNVVASYVGAFALDIGGPAFTTLAVDGGRSVAGARAPSHCAAGGDVAAHLSTR